MIAKYVLYSSLASTSFLFACSPLFHPFCFQIVPSISLWLPPSQSILSASLLLFAPSEVSDWCNCRPCSIYNAQQVSRNTHTQTHKQTHRRAYTHRHTHTQKNTHSRLHLRCNTHFWKLCLGGASVCACVSIPLVETAGKGNRFHPPGTSSYTVYKAKKERHPPHRTTYCFSPKNISTVGIHIHYGANEITASCCDTSRRVLQKGANIGNR